MKKFILGFVMAIVSIIVGALIFVGKIVHRGSKNMPCTTKRYIKDQFTFVDISKVQDAVANSIKAFVDWAFFAKETKETPDFEQRGVDTFYYDNKPVYRVYKSCESCKYKSDMFDRSYHAQKHNDICKAIDKCTAKSDKMKFMYDISTDKLYDDYGDEAVESYDFIKDMLKAEDSCIIIEPGNRVYIRDPRDGTDYMIAIENLSQDEEKSKEE